MDSIAKDEKDDVPMQFRDARKADCRMWYMPKDIVSVENTWTRIARGLKVGGKGLCVQGDLKGPGDNDTPAGGGNITITAAGPPASIPSAVPKSSAGRSWYSSLAVRGAIALTMMASLS